MTHFEVVSDRAVTVDGIGLLEPNSPVVLTDDILALFHGLHGHALTRSSLPPFVQIVAVQDEDGEDNDEDEVVETVDAVVEEKEEGE